VEELDEVVSLLGPLLDLFLTNTTTITGVWDGNEEPERSRNSEEDGGEEEAVVVSEPGDGGGGGESTDGTSDFVEDMLGGIRWSES